MKTVRRHELQTNVLADSLGHYLQAAQPWLKTGAIVAAAAVVIGLGALMLSQRQHAKSGAGWTAFARVVGDDATTSENQAKDFRKVHEDFGSSSAGLYARLAAGGLALHRGAEQLFVNRKEAESALKEAKRDFEIVVDQARDPLLVDRARFALAETQECMSEFEKALENYEQVARSRSDAALANAASQKVTRLKKSGVEDWYAWFGKQQPRPARAPTRPGGAAEFGESLFNDLPRVPDLKFMGSDEYKADASAREP